jgi:hypothetical protein
MYISDVNKIKRKMSKVCNKAINSIIDQLIANEQLAIASSGDAELQFVIEKCQIKFDLDIKDPSKANTFQMVCHPSVDLK